MQFARRATDAPPTHPLITELGTMNILAAVPTPLLVCDPKGEIVYYNDAAVIAAERLDADYGDWAFSGMWERLRGMVDDAATHGQTQLVTVDGPDRQVSFEVGLSHMPVGTVFTWREVTAEVDTIRTLTETAGELANAYHAYDPETTPHAEPAAAHEGTGTGAETGGAAPVAGDAVTAVEPDEAGQWREPVPVAAEAPGPAGRPDVTIGAGAQPRMTSQAYRMAKIGVIPLPTDQPEEPGNVGNLIEAVLEQVNLLARNANIGGR